MRTWDEVIQIYTHMTCFDNQALLSYRFTSRMIMECRQSIVGTRTQWSPREWGSRCFGYKLGSLHNFVRPGPVVPISALGVRFEAIKLSKLLIRNPDLNRNDQLLPLDRKNLRNVVKEWKMCEDAQGTSIHVHIMYLCQCKGLAALMMKCCSAAFVDVEDVKDIAIRRISFFCGQHKTVLVISSTTFCCKHK